MKDANKRLMMSIAVLVVAVALAATSTFAWLTMDTTPEVNNIDVAISIQDGLYVSTTGKDGDYYTRIDLSGGDTITGLGFITPKKGDPSGFSFVTIAPGTLSTSMATTAYASITVYIRSQSNYNIHVKNVTVTAKDPQNSAQNIDSWKITAAQMGLTGEEWNSTLYPNATNAAGEALSGTHTLIATDILVPQGAELPVEATVENALRVGFASNGELVKIINPNAGLGWEAEDYEGYNAAHDYYKTVTAMSASEKTTFDSAWANPDTAFNSITITQTALAGYDADGAGTDYSPVGHTAGNRLLGGTGGDPVAPTGGLTLLTAPGSGQYYTDWATVNGWYVATLTVYIWAEGTDPDCFNEILKDGASVSFELSGEYVPQS